MPTLTALNITPIPTFAAKIIEIMPSSVPLAKSVVWSPKIPSWTLPTIAIAPVQNKMEAFTKPSAIFAATEASPLATFPPTQSPKRCIRSSISTLSPIMAPITKLQMVMMMLLVFIAICKPITTMHKAMPLIMVCCHFSGKPRFKTTPIKEPTTIAAQFIIVPKPGITLPPHPSKNYTCNLRGATSTGLISTLGCSASKILSKSSGE